MDDELFFASPAPKAGVNVVRDIDYNRKNAIFAENIINSRMFSIFFIYCYRCYS